LQRRSEKERDWVVGERERAPGTVTVTCRKRDRSGEGDTERERERKMTGGREKTEREDGEREGSCTEESHLMSYTRVSSDVEYKSLNLCTKEPVVWAHLRSNFI